MTPVLNLLSVCCWLLGAYCFFRGARYMGWSLAAGQRLERMRRTTTGGLSLVMLGLVLQASSWAEFFKLGLIWWLSMLVAAALIQAARRETVAAEQV